MKFTTTRILMFVIALALLTLAACSNSTAPSSSAETPPSESTAPRQSSSNTTSSSKETLPSQSESTAPSSSSSAPSSEPPSPASSQSEAPPQQTSSEAQSSSPTTNTAQTLDGANFYGGIDDSTTIIVQGFGRVDLNYEQATNLFGNMSFAGLTPADKDYQMEMYGPEESINFVSPRFAHELRLDKATGVAMYQTGGNIYYYTFPDDEYAIILDFVMRAYNETSFPEAETDENGNLNVVTG